MSGVPGRALETPDIGSLHRCCSLGGRERPVIKLGELIMILELHRQGLSVSAIARQLGIDRKTVRVYIARGLEPPAYKSRSPRPAIIDPFKAYLGERLRAYPGL